MANKKYAFIDRDGTIIQEPEDFQVDRLDKVKFVDGVVPALLELQQLGFKLVMVTNQDGLGTASFPEEDFWLVQNFMMQILNSQGVHFERVAICPHLPADSCECRKPRVGLLLPEIRSGEIDYKKSFVVGDRPSDIELAKNLGLTSYKLGEVSWNEIIHEHKIGHRKSHKSRSTKETQISVSLDLNGTGQSQINTGHGFFDHMLEQIAKHSGIDITLECKGDLHIDEHHTVEDVALTLGDALQEALGDKRGIERYGFLLPMDESRIEVALDLSGRPYFVFEGEFPRQEVGGLSAEMVKHFFRSVSETLKANLHIRVSGDNTHHMVEGCFKAFARALKQAIKVNPGQGLPSTKGSL